MTGLKLYEVPIMKIILFLLIVLNSCHFNIDVTKRYQLYFDDSTYGKYQQGVNAYLDGDYLIADSLFSIVIENSNDKLTIDMPMEFNPYYYRGHNNIDLAKYQQAISDFEHVAEETTTNTSILVARTEAFRMLGKYDTAISLCNRLLQLGYDSSIVLSQRGICFYQKKDFKNACSDLTTAKMLLKDSTSYLDQFLKECK
jgi:tetratricopeptide (TPR) repeat protein